MHRGCEYPSIHLSVIHLHIQVSMFVLSCQSSAPPPTHSNMQNFLKRIRDACYSNYVWCQNWGTLPNNEGVLFETRKQHLKSRLTQETGHFFFLIGMLSELKNEVQRKAGVRVPREISCEEVGSPSLPSFEGESVVAQKQEMIGTESLNKFCESCSSHPSHILLSTFILCFSLCSFI